MPSMSAVRPVRLPFSAEIEFRIYAYRGVVVAPIISEGQLTSKALLDVVHCLRLSTANTEVSGVL